MSEPRPEQPARSDEDIDAGEQSGAGIPPVTEQAASAPADEQPTGPERHSPAWIARLPGPVRSPLIRTGDRVRTALAPITRLIGASASQIVVTGLCLILLFAAVANRAVADDGQDPVPEATNVTTRALEDLNRAQKYMSAKLTPVDKDKIRIVEQGYTPIKDIGDDNLVTYGAVLENTDPERVATVQVGVQILDRQGRSLIDALYTHRIVRHLMPGQRGGVTDCVYLNGPNVATVRLTVEQVAWSPVDPKRWYSAPLSATLLDTGVRKGEGDTLYWGKGGMRAIPAGDDLLVRFEVTSGYAGVVDRRIGVARPGVAVVFRNAAGAIIGGSDEIFSVYAQYPPGRSEHTMQVKYGPPPGTDTSKIEIYAYPAELTYRY